MIKSLLAAGCGGFLGTIVRFLINKFCSNLWVTSLPIATFIANMAGCFIFGIIIGLLQRNNLMDSRLYTFLIVGFCGGLTTFSTFTNDLIMLDINSNIILPFVYCIASVILGLAFLLLGKAII